MAFNNLALPHYARYFKTQFTRYRPQPSDFKSKVLPYLTSKPNRPKDAVYLSALATVRRLFALPAKVNPLHINDSIKYFQNGDKSPGLPYTARGIKQKRDVPVNEIKQYVHNVKYGIYQHCRTPCTGAARTMISKSTEKKFRLIWVYPAHMTLAEGMFAQPLIWAYQRLEGPYGIWIQYARGDAKRLMAAKRFPSQRWLGMDWTAFDANVPSWMIRDAFQILREQMDFSKYQERGVPTHDFTLDTLWNHLVHYFINTPIKLPTGEVLKTRRGVPSGSYFTNILDSVINAIAVHYCLESLNVRYSKCWFMGDDSLVLISKPALNIDDLARIAFVTFGFELNTSKSDFSPHSVKFLGFTLKGGRPYADYDKLVGMLICPSSRDVCEQDFIARARALQLSCFGIGCMRFTAEIDEFLIRVGHETAYPSLHPKNELVSKLQQMGLADWPPLSKVMDAVM
nr:hypothetical protein [Leuven Partiti-like virus 4]